MNKLAWTAFIAFWSSMTTLLAVYFLFAEEPSSAVQKGDGALRSVPLEELARHDSEASCWMAIRGEVYDVTGYLPEHPAPRSAILDWCGRESTVAWNTKGYGRPHSAKAEQMLEAYRIGRLEEAGQAAR